MKYQIRTLKNVALELWYKYNGPERPQFSLNEVEMARIKRMQSLPKDASIQDIEEAYQVPLIIDHCNECATTPESNIIFEYGAGDSWHICLQCLLIRLKGKINKRAEQMLTMVKMYLSIKINKTERLKHESEDQEAG